MLFTAFDGSSLGEPAKNTERYPRDGRRRVLVVESETKIADTITSILEENGYATGIAADAKTAMLELNDFEPDLVLLGTYLADMPGYELNQILRGAPQYSWRYRHIGLLYVADRHKLLMHRLIGAPEVPLTHYIFKPIDATELLDKVARTIATAAATAAPG